MTKLAGFSCALFSLFVCTCVCFSCLADYFIDSLCVLIPVLPESLVVLFPPFQDLLLSLSFFLFLSFSLSQSCRGSFTSTSTLTSTPTPTIMLFCLYPLHGFVLRPQWQGPGDEVTLHRRAAGLTEPQPSPPSSSAQRTNSSLTSPSTVLLFLCFTYMPMQTTGHAHKHHFSEVHISQAACLQASADNNTDMSTSMSPHVHARRHARMRAHTPAHMRTHTHAQRLHR